MIEVERLRKATAVSVSFDTLGYMPILIAKRNEKVRLIGPESWESEGRWAVGWILDDEKGAIFEAPIRETLKRGGWLHVEERIEFPEPENYVVWSAPPGARRKDVFPTVPLVQKEPIDIPTLLAYRWRHGTHRPLTHEGYEEAVNKANTIITMARMGHPAYNRLLDKVRADLESESSP